MVYRSSDKDYQGDIFYVGKDKEDKYYFLVQGYGSCNGCDAYQSAESICEHDKNLESLRLAVNSRDFSREMKQRKSLDKWQIV
jgi:hypothetical protein